MEGLYEVKKVFCGFFFEMRKHNSLLVDEANDAVTAGKLIQAREGP